MKIARILGLVFLSIILLWAILSIFARQHFHIERSVDIAAPYSLVYENVRYYKNFPKWSPWHNYDPAMETKIENTDGELGAVYRWKGNDKLGTGWQELKGVAPDKLEFKIFFSEWRDQPSDMAYYFQEKNDSTTNVTWTMDMHVPRPWNAFAMLTDVNAFVGKDFAQGLENLKSISGEMAKKTYRGFRVQEVSFSKRFYIGIRKTVPLADIQKFYAANFPKILEEVQNAGAQMTGFPSGLYWMWDDSTATADMAAALPTNASTGIPNLQMFPIGGKKAFVIDYYGPYEGSGDAHFAMDDFFADRKLEKGPFIIEEYITDPTTQPDSMKWLTKIIYFTKE